MDKVHFVNLGDLAAPTKNAIAIGPFGSRMKAEVYVSEGVPVIRGTNIGTDRALKGDWVYVTDAFADGITNCNVNLGDLVFPHRGSIGEVALIDDRHGRMVLSSSMMKFKADLSIAEPEFLYYYFRSPEGRNEILRFGSQVGTPGIGQPLASLRQFRVPSFPLAAQKKIAMLLRALDEKIELNRQMNETLEAMAQAIFRDWFVDFGPTRRKLEGSTDPVEIMGGLVTDAARAQQLADLFPSSFGDDGLPAGWRDGELSELVEIQSGKRPPTKVISRDANHRYPVWGGNGVGWYSDSYLFEHPFIITGRVGTLGTVYRVNGRVWASDNALCVFPKTAELFDFVYYAMSAFDYHGLNSGSTQPLITQSVLKKQRVLIASDGVYEAFSSIVEKLMSLYTHNSQNSDTLAATRDLLLPKLMSGEIELRDAEEQLEAAQ